ncbi:MAG: DNA polymerase III subunit gamma/tau [Arenimonas sp.]
MSYLVLARKWRPKKFTELVGQEHVVKALTNALDTGRVHHAFLFTGTRGVGKTTIARIFAKSLNCEKGESSDPCGVCNACLDIDAGRFVDLLEIDAASNTGVDDVRDLIDNAQYMPARGRTKVYLIDEVHMLSKNAFNALLKTLEEPPGHVKFLLATTDPQKLPITVLSRCLQFNLRRLDESQIGGQISKILAAENIEVEAAAVKLLARSADGSLRDGLSLLDQAIAYTGGKLTAESVNAMLGTVDNAQVGGLLDALSLGDAAALMAKVEEMSVYSPDFAHVLDDRAIALHQLQCTQLVPGFETESSSVDFATLASRLGAEQVQLWYQMVTNGRRDLAYAPSPRAGFEMSLLRMLAFRPMTEGETISTPASTAVKSVAKMPVPTQTAPVIAAPKPIMAPAEMPVVHTPIDQAPAVATPPITIHQQTKRELKDHEQWLQVIEVVELKGPARELAAHSIFVAFDNGILKLALPDGFLHLRSDAVVVGLSQKLAPALGEVAKIIFEKAHMQSETLHDRTARVRSEKQTDAQSAFMADPVVSQLLQQGAQIVPDSIRPLD